MLMLDTQVYSNTGGQNSDSSTMLGGYDMNQFGVASQGKLIEKKNVAEAFTSGHGSPFVAQVSMANAAKLYKAMLDGLEYRGTAFFQAYTTCQPEHGVADNMATDQARLAVDTRAFPLLIYDPRKGDTIKERLTLQGNPAINEDWWTNPKTNQQVDFIDFARSEGRFAKHFDAEGNPSHTLLMAKQDRLENWHVLQELAGALKKSGDKELAKKEAAKKDAAKPATAAAPAKPVRPGGNGHSAPLPEGFIVGSRIKFNDAGRWVAGVVQALSPTLLSLDDDTEIRIPDEVLGNAIREGLIERQ
jgi:hypothetical protein